VPAGSFLDCYTHDTSSELLPFGAAAPSVRNTDYKLSLLQLAWYTTG